MRKYRFVKSFILGVLIIIFIVGCSKKENPAKVSKDDIHIEHEFALDFDDKYKVDGKIQNLTDKVINNLIVGYKVKTKEGKELDLGTTKIDKIEPKEITKFTIDADKAFRESKANIDDLKSFEFYFN